MQGADSPLDTERDVFVVNLGGFDTHSDLLEDFSANMQVRIYVTRLFFFVDFGRWIMRLLAALFTTLHHNYGVTQLYQAVEMSFVYYASE